jgi:hypothetical protein
MTLRIPEERANLVGWPLVAMMGHTMPPRDPNDDEDDEEEEDEEEDRDDEPPVVREPDED